MTWIMEKSIIEYIKLSNYLIDIDVYYFLRYYLNSNVVNLTNCYSTHELRTKYTERHTE